MKVIVEYRPLHESALQVARELWAEALHVGATGHRWPEDLSGLDRMEVAVAIGMVHSYRSEGL